MSDSTPSAGPPASAAVPAPPNPVPAAPLVDAATAFAALGNALRWEIVRLLGDGRVRSSSEVAATLKRDFDIVNKHLKQLRDAGWLAWRAGEDRRMVLYSIPEANRREPGVLDYGWVRIQLGRTQ